jgi:serine/threonine protein kinase
MSLTPGTKLGPYEILTPIGAGGMGEVYKAKDTRLDRTVAIKVLPSHLSDNTHLKERFEREARAVSSLNHPHICTLYDIGSENGVDFMVMEHIEGETLADRLKKGALPLDQALRYGIEIADALDKAHRQGVVHRDLKPGNIMLTKSGAKILDFGLAKITAEQTNAAGLSALPFSVHGTENILGKAPKEVRAELKAAILESFHAQSYEQGLKKGQEVVARYRQRFPSAMKCMEETLEACLQALRLPPAHHKRLRTANLLERTFGEHKRRTNVIPHFFTEEAARDEGITGAHCESTSRQAG